MLLSAAAVLALMAEATTVKAKPDPRDPDKLICRRQLETGSLVKGKRVCLTRREWAKVADDARNLGQDMQDANGRLVTGGN